MGTPDETFAVRWDADEVTNLRAALVAGIAAGDLASALPVASVAGWHWYTHGSLEEGRLVTDLVADVLADERAEARADDLGGTVLVAGIICWARGELDDAAALLGRALAMAEAGHVVRRSAIAHAFLGHLARTSGELDLAAAEHTLAQASFRALGNRLGDAWASHDLALVALGAGRAEDAAGLLAEALPVFVTEQDAWAVAVGRRRPGRGGPAPPRVGPGRRTPRGRAATSSSPTATSRARRTASPCSPSWPPPAGWTDRPSASRPGCVARPRCPRWPGRWRRVRQRPRAHSPPGSARSRRWSRRVPRIDRSPARSGIADKTVEVHLAQIMHRLGVQNRAQVAAHAAHSGLD